MKQQILHEADSEFGKYSVADVIYNDRPSRVLYGPSDTPQSGVALDDDPELLFNYNQRFLEIFQTIQPARVLVIGGGALTLPMALRRQFADAVIDVVEINPLLPRLAADYFGYTSAMAISVTVADGVTFMQQCTAQYDAIVIDAFSGRDVVTELLSDAMVRRYHDCLAPGGVVTANVISRYYTRRPTLIRQLVTSFETQFADVQLYPADYREPKRHEQNIILTAAVSPQSYDYLQSLPVTLLPLAEHS